MVQCTNHNTFVNNIKVKHKKLQTKSVLSKSLLYFFFFNLINFILLIFGVVDWHGEKKNDCLSFF